MRSKAPPLEALQRPDRAGECLLPVGQVCRLDAGVCVDCLDNNNCAAPNRVCSPNNTCVRCLANTDCGGGATCNPTLHQCQRTCTWPYCQPNGFCGECLSDVQCPNGTACQPQGGQRTVFICD